MRSSSYLNHHLGGIFLWKRQARKKHNLASLLLSLKKTDLELDFYSSLDSELLKDIWDKVL